MSITWSKYFNKIYCINFIQYRQRKELMQFELKRVGILDSGIFEWYTTYGNNFNKALQKCAYQNYETLYKDNPWTNVSLMFGHYNIIRNALTNNYQHILILEDDARFLKDLDKIEQILQNRPEDYNIILYDKMISDFIQTKQFTPINEYFSTFNYAWSAACYELDREGMKKLKELIETVPQPIDNYFAISKYLGNEVKYCCSKTNMAVQVTFEDANNLNKIWKDAGSIHQYYKALEIQFDDYMMKKDGSIYYYGDSLKIQKNEKDKISQLKLAEGININLNSPINYSKEMNICIGVTEQNFEKIFPLIYTLKKFSSSKLKIHIVIDSYQFSKLYAQIQKFKDKRTDFSIFNYAILASYLNVDYIYDNFTAESYIKLIVPSLFPQYDRMLYLDPDVIIKNKGIEWLYNIDLQDNYLAACEDIIFKFSSSVEQRSRQQTSIFNLDKDKNLKYFDSGVILFNNEKIIKDGLDNHLLNILQTLQTNENNPLLCQYFSNKLLDMASMGKKSVKFCYGDKSLLNYIFIDKKKIIFNPIFNNFQMSMLYGSDTILFQQELFEKWNIKDEQELVDNTIIVQFIPPKQPWNTDYSKQYFLTKYQKQLVDYYNEVIEEMEKQND